MGTKCYLLVVLKINFMWENETRKREGSECGYREHEMGHELVIAGNGWWVNGDSLSYSLYFSIYLKFSTIRKSSSRIQSFKKKEKWPEQKGTDHSRRSLQKGPCRRADRQDGTKRSWEEGFQTVLGFKLEELSTWVINSVFLMTLDNTAVLTKCYQIFKVPWR